MPPTVLSGILFSPRGGSAHAARALSRGLRERGWEVRLVAGSQSRGRGDSDAKEFYGEETYAVSFDEALASSEPLGYEGATGTAPMHPSYEDRPGAPDKVFAVLDDADYERQVRAWARALRDAEAESADVLHLHHLTPLNEAAARVAPDVPVVGQLHGTELLMLERIAAGAPPEWKYAEEWAERMRDWACRCERLIVAPAGAPRAVRQLSVPRERIVVLPNGVDIRLFFPHEVDRGKIWQRVLAEEPRGWLPDQDPGSAHYPPDQVEQLTRSTVFVYAGRFTEVKRLDRLIAAFGRASERSSCPCSLVLVGGSPGEWEGEHPAELAARLGLENVFLAGWYHQEELPDLFAASDVMVLASEREQFGQVLVEFMACGLPVIAPRLFGPGMIVENGRSGWLTEPDEEDALEQAIVEAADDPQERARRGAASLEVARVRFSWQEICGELATVLEGAMRFLPRA
jgi:glycosyltransferase involved in cell wall biosynthesis